MGTSNNSIRHCKFDQQSPENKEILKQVQNDGNICRSVLMIKIAKLVSIIFHPVFITLYCAVIFIINPKNSAFYSSLEKVIFFGIIILFTLIIPCLIMLYKYKQGKISDITLTNRSERTPIYLLSIASSLICAYFLLILVNAYIFVLFMIFALFSVATITFINLKWKISIHSCGMGILTGFTLFFAVYFYQNPVYWFCSVVFLSGLVMTCRCILGVHSVWQVTAGYFVGLIFTAAPIIILLLNEILKENY